MIRKTFFTGIITLVVVMEILVVSCDNPTNSSDEYPDITGAVIINNRSPCLGDTLTAIYSGGNGSGTAIWKWLRDDTAIPNSNSNTYTVTAIDVGKTLKAQVSFTEQKGSITSPSTNFVIADNRPILTGTITIDNNSPNQGDTLTATYFDGNGSGTATWQWLRGDAIILGANNSTYIVTNLDVGKVLKVQVNFTNQRGNVASVPTNFVTTILTGIVTINNNSPNLGDTLTATYSAGNGSGTATWQWLMDDVRISNSNSNTYTVTTADIGKTLKVTVKFSNQNGSVISVATDVVTAVLTGTVIIDNTLPNVGNILTATYSGGNGSGTSTWQWLRNDTTIPDTNYSTYVITTDDVNKTLMAQVNFSGQNGIIISAPTAIVPSFYWTSAEYNVLDSYWDRFHSLSSVTSIAWNGDKFVAVGDSGRIAYSTDGIAWTRIYDTRFNSSDMTNDNIYDIAWGGPAGQEKFIVTAWSHCAYSANGVTWSFLNGPDKSSSPAPARSIVWGGPVGYEKFIVGGFQGRIFYSDGVTWTHSSELDWQGASSPFYSSRSAIYSIVWGGLAGQEKFIAGGADGKMAYSSNGVTWTAVENTSFGDNFTDYIHGIAWGGPLGQEKFIAVGSKGRMAYSVDGITWVAIENTTFGSSNINAVAWGVDKFVSVGADGKMAYSTDGMTWIAMGYTPLENRGISAIIWGGDKFVAGGKSGTPIYSSEVK